MISPPLAPPRSPTSPHPTLYPFSPSLENKRTSKQIKKRPQEIHKHIFIENRFQR